MIWTWKADYTLRITPAANVDIPDPNLRSKLRDAIESRLGHRRSSDH